jgi:hypothetical protein
VWRKKGAVVPFLLHREVVMRAQVKTEQRGSLPRVRHPRLLRRRAPAALGERELGDDPVKVVHSACLSQHQCAVRLLDLAAVLGHRPLRVQAPRGCPNSAVTAPAARLYETDRQRLVAVRLWGDLDVPSTRHVGAEELCIRAPGERVKEPQG